MTFTVEKTYGADHDGGMPEIRHCEDFASLSATLEDLAGLKRSVADEDAADLISGKLPELRRLDPETGDEVIAWRG